MRKLFVFTIHFLSIRPVFNSKWRLKPFGLELFGDSDSRIPQGAPSGIDPGALSAAPASAAGYGSQVTDPSPLSPAGGLFHISTQAVS